MAVCGVVDPTCWLGNAASTVAGDAIDKLANVVLQGLGRALQSLSTMWVNVPTPDLATSTGGTQPSGPVGFLWESLGWYTGAIAVLAVIIAGARMAWEQRAEPGRELLKSLMTMTVVFGAGLAAISLGVAAMDGLAKWIIDRSGGGGAGFGRNVGTILGFGPNHAQTQALGAFVIIVVGGFAFLAAVIQLMLMIARGGMLVLLTGVLPFTAAATTTEWGRTWFRRSVSWLVAFTLYKPVAAIVYATAFRLAGTDLFGGTDSLMQFLSGVMLMVLAIVALPALMRFTTPLVTATAGGGGASMAATSALAALPTGAMALGGGRGASSNSGGGAPPASPGPTGSDGTANGQSAGGDPGPSSGPTGGGSSPSGGSAAGAAEGSSGATAGSTAGAGAGSTASGAAGGAATAAGPAAPAVAAAQTVKKIGQAGADGARAVADDTTGGGPSGSQ